MCEDGARYAQVGSPSDVFPPGLANRGEANRGRVVVRDVRDVRDDRRTHFDSALL